MLILEADWLVLPGGKLEKGPVYVTIEGDKITGVHNQCPRPTTEHPVVHAHLVTPGFVDIHTHGVGGSDDVIDSWLHPEYSQRVYPQQGTTSFLATVVFPKSHPQRTAALLSRLREAVGRIGDGAVLEGVHAEGPIVHDLGAMPPSDTAISLDDFEQLLDSIPSLRVMTISPHLEAGEGYGRMKALLQRGVLPALGHDRVATETDILGALSLTPGRRMHVTHLFNVCNFHHRLPSLVNFGLTEDFPKLPQYKTILPPTVELVGDLAHVHPMVVSMVMKARSFSNVCFVTDSVMEPKPGATVKYMGRELQVSEDGKTLSTMGSERVLAGSCCSMVDILHNLVNVIGLPLGQAVAMLTENPARIAGLDHIGTIEVGKRADLLLFDKELNLQQTIIAGRTVFERKK